jgi:hypothetical protein
MLNRNPVPTISTGRAIKGTPLLSGKSNSLEITDVLHTQPKGPAQSTAPDHPTIAVRYTCDTVANLLLPGR